MSEVTDLKQQLEIRHNEIRNLNATIDSLKSINEELKVNNFVSYLQVTDAFDIARICYDVCWNWRRQNLAESARDLERIRKAINVQLAEFDDVKKSLIHDLQNRCEKVGKMFFYDKQNWQFSKVVELETQLDEMKEQYSNVIRRREGGEPGTTNGTHE